jgi:hypothetical protein
MIFADLRPVRFCHDHAHQIMGLWIQWRDAHSVAGMNFGFGQTALSE